MQDSFTQFFTVPGTVILKYFLLNLLETKIVVDFINSDENQDDGTTGRL